MKIFHVLSHSYDWQALVTWLWEYAYKRQHARSLPQLDSSIISALTDANDNAGSWRVQRAKRFLNRDRNLSSGVRCLLELYPWFGAQLYLDKPSSSSVKKGAEVWHILFTVRVKLQHLAG